MSDPADNYLRDTVVELLERAREARADATAKATQHGDQGAAFEAGRAFAYFEVVSYLISQLDAFGIARSSVGVPATFDPERDLL